MEMPYMTSNDLRGLLRSCQDQTSGFDWTPLFRQVEAALYINKFYLGWQRPDLIGPYVATIANEAADLYQGLPVPILQASLDMVPAVQRPYQDSFMVGEGCKGISTMVVWAHYVLGLTVRIFIFKLTLLVWNMLNILGPSDWDA
jgi:hypothetical protein